MTVWIMDAALLAAQLAQEGAAGDTLLMRQIPGEPSTVERIASIASMLMTISILVLTVALVPAAWNFRKSYKRINDLLDRVYADINPIVKHASTIADNVNYISTSIRVDVQQVNQTIALANQRLVEAVQMAERRVRELDALVEIVQEEAEEVFVTAASTVHGVRAGADSFRRQVNARAEQKAAEKSDFAGWDSSVGPHDAGLHDAGLEEEYIGFDELDASEVNDGSRDRGPGGAGSTGPRIRRRQRTDE
jgi:uncharacterized protein YoxC